MTEKSFPTSVRLTEVDKLLLKALVEHFRTTNVSKVSENDVMRLALKRLAEGVKMQNPRCRVLLKGEIEPRDGVEVFSQNGETGLAFLHDDHPTRKGWDSQVRVSRLEHGWYEDGMQILEAEARLSKRAMC